MTYRHHRLQKGAATIVVTLVVLLIATIMVSFANRSIIFDLRSSANEARYIEAMTAAEAGLDFAAAKFVANFRTTFDGSNASSTNTSLETILTNSQVNSNTTSSGSIANTGETYFNATISNSGITSPLGSIPIYTIVANGKSADGTASAIVQRQFTMVNAFSGTLPNVPLIIGGAIGTGGNFNIVANPDGGNTPGAPLSVWSRSDIYLSTSSATCQIQFYTNGSCPNPSGNTERISSGTGSTLSTYNNTFPDLLPRDPNFPSDLFKFLFGVTSSNWESIKSVTAAVNQAKTDCNDLTAAGTNAGANFPIWWITGNCNLQGAIIGSTTKPVILVIDDHQLTMNGTSKLNGVTYIFNNPSSTSTPSAQLNGGAEIIGSLVSDVGDSAMTGTFSVKYDPNLISSFSKNGSSYTLANIPNSWRDFQ